MSANGDRLKFIGTSVSMYFLLFGLGFSADLAIRGDLHYLVAFLVGVLLGALLLTIYSLARKFYRLQLRGEYNRGVIDGGLKREDWYTEKFPVPLRSGDAIIGNIQRGYEWWIDNNNERVLDNARTFQAKFEEPSTVVDVHYPGEQVERERRKNAGRPA